MIEIKQLEWLDSPNPYLVDIYAKSNNGYVWGIVKYNERFLIEKLHLSKHITTLHFRENFDTTEECKKYAQRIHNQEMNEIINNFLIIKE